MKAHFSVKRYEMVAAPGVVVHLPQIPWANITREPAKNPVAKLRILIGSQVLAAELRRDDVRRLRDLLSEVLEDWDA